MVLKHYKEHFGHHQQFATFDPGCREDGGTGFAKFSRQSKSRKPLETKLFQCTFLKNWASRVAMVCTSIDAHLQSEKVYGDYPIFIEKPEFFETHKGLTAARSESLFKLITLYGRIFQIVHSNHFTPVPLRIIDWKGQLKKHMVQHRIENITGEKYQGDVCDAVGMGLYLQGYL